MRLVKFTDIHSEDKDTIIIDVEKIIIVSKSQTLPRYIQLKIEEEIKKEKEENKEKRTFSIGESLINQFDEIEKRGKKYCLNTYNLCLTNNIHINVLKEEFDRIFNV